MLQCVRETTDPHNPFAVAVLHGSSHLPRDLSALCVLFIQQNGKSKRKKGRLEVPIVSTFRGEDKEVQKAKELIEYINATTVVKCRPGSYITKLDIAEKRSKNKKQKMSNDQES